MAPALVHMVQHKDKIENACVQTIHKSECQIRGEVMSGEAAERMLVGIGVLR